MYSLLAYLASPNTYGIPYIHASSYAAGTFSLVAFYPWKQPWARYRAVLELLLFVFLFLYLVALMSWNNDELTFTHYANTLTCMVWVFISYILGKSLGQLTLVSAQRQLEVQRRNFGEFFDFLHSNVKAGIAAVRADLPLEQVGARHLLEELETAVSDYRVELALALEQVPLAALFSERIRTFVGSIRIADTPRIGALTVPRRIGIVIGRALGDLLTNAVVHGAGVVQIGFDYSTALVALRVTDDGPGFPSDVLDDPSRSLYRLRASARDLGGDLVKVDNPTRGVCMMLTIPLGKRTVTA